MFFLIQMKSQNTKMTRSQKHWEGKSLTEDQVRKVSSGDSSIQGLFFKNIEGQVLFNDQWIYLVKGVKESTYEWIYTGRGVNTQVDQDLTNEVEWMNENGMDREWRKTHICKDPGEWKKVPVSASKKRSSRSKKRKFKNNKRKTSSSKKLAKKKRKRKSRKKKTYTKTFPLCVQSSIQKVVEYMGLSKHTEELQKLMCSNLSFEEVTHRFETCGGFKRLPSVGCDEFDPRKTDRKVLHVLQICAVHKVNNANKDKEHCISIFNNKIFDQNFDVPLQLSMKNMDKCCLGGSDWVYHHACRIRMFSPCPYLINQMSLDIQNIFKY